MRTIVVSEFGGPAQLRLEDVADPVPGTVEVPVRIEVDWARLAHLVRG